jgi:myo-inositol 2-dehydrogenase/D-chiro-inositol 1-dehydrogenase
MSKKINIGIIGAGKIGKLHANNLSTFAEVKIRAISDVYIDQMTDWVSTFGVDYVTTDYKDILHDPEIDAVLVCTPTKMHVEIVLEAATFKKHVFCEKPISFILEDTLKVLQAVKEAGILFQVGFVRRFDHNFKKVHELVRQGRIGTPHIIHIFSRDPEPAPKEYVKHSGGMPFDMTIHDFDMIRYLTQFEVEEVYAQGSVLIDEFFRECNDIDTAVYLLRFTNGSLGVIDNSRKAEYGYDQRVEVFGSRGSITIKNDVDNSAEVMTKEGVLSEKPKWFYLERYNEAFKEELKSFLKCIVTGQEPIVNGNDGLQAELMAHAAARSLKEGRPVKIQEILLESTGRIPRL